jgi:hypothetical protein
VPIRQISIQHRLAGRTGHRFHQALGCLEEALRRGMEPILFLNAAAEPEVRAALPIGRPVFVDPVFRTDWTYDQRTASFVAQLHAHVDPVVRRDDRVLMTVATQCEARALATWLSELPTRRRPWILVLFPADRWNRSGPEERERQVAEFRTLAAELAELAARGPEAHRRLLFASHTRGLTAELAGLLGIPVLLSPMTETLPPAPPTPPAPKLSAAPSRPATVAVVGGARPEKGSHLLPGIVRASRARTAVDFRIQLANEQLSAEDFAALCRLADEPGIETFPGALDPRVYFEILATSDLLLLPYRRINYRQRPSGILSEAVLAGLPIVAPAGTWLSEQIESGAAAGVTYEGESAEDIGEAIARAVVILPALRDRAAACTPAWRRRHSMTAFLDWLEAEIAERGAGEPPRGLAALWRRGFRA